MISFGDRISSASRGRPAKQLADIKEMPIPPHCAAFRPTSFYTKEKKETTTERKNALDSEIVIAGSHQSR